MGGGSGGGRGSIILYLCLFSPLRSDQQSARREELSEAVAVLCNQVLVLHCSISTSYQLFLL